MTKKMLIDATHAEETRVVVLDGTKVDEFDFESLNKKQLAGNIYLAKVTRVEPSLQAAFVDYGGNRHGFLAFSEIHPDYYQIPKADREALLAEEAALAREAEEEAERPAPEPKEQKTSRSRSRSRKRSQPAGEGAPASQDAVLESGPVADAEAGAGQPDEVRVDPAASPDASAQDFASEAVAEPVAEPVAGPSEDIGSDGNGEGGETSEPMLVETPEDGANETESIGGQDNPREEQLPRRPRPRRYKIQEVIKVRQILLVQVIKEERGNKGAALTTYLSLAGRYCVLMPNTARGGGISRKITNAADRKKLKEISGSITVPEGAGLIIRTAGANRTKTEIRRDYEYLLRQWEQIRDLTLRSVAPFLIYEEGSLVKRAIRDLYSRDIDEVLVDGERGYREAKDYMKMLTPSHAKNVKHYAEALPLFSRFQVESYLAGMFNPVVQLKSGGYIVIDVTEALVAIDVNSGRATREASIEDTALKTNLEAAEEAARQMRLRDLAGLIVIDFIDMDERKNNAAVEKKLKEKLKTDRARIQVGRISSFGLLEMSRQRLRPGMIEATTKGCPHCHGTGRVRSDDSVALALLREVEEEGVRQRSKEVLVVVPVEIANYLLNHKREHVALIERRFGLSVRIEGDAALINPDYRIERFKTASRLIPAAEGMAPVKIEEEEDLPEPEDEVEEGTLEAAPSASDSGDEKAPPKKKRRRRRRGGAKSARDGSDEQIATGADENGDSDAPVAQEGGETQPASESEAGADLPSGVSEDQPNRVETTEAASGGFGDVIDLGPDEAPEIVAVPESEHVQRPGRRPRVSQPAVAVLAEVSAIPAGETGFGEGEAAPGAEGPLEAIEHPVPEVGFAEVPQEAVELADDASQGEDPGAEKPGGDTPEIAAAGYGSEQEEDAGPKRRGWWSRAGSAG